MRNSHMIMRGNDYIYDMHNVVCNDSRCKTQSNAKHITRKRLLVWDVAEYQVGQQIYGIFKFLNIVEYQTAINLSRWGSLRRCQFTAKVKYVCFNGVEASTISASFVS